MNPNWSRSHSSQAEILTYLQEVADYYDVSKHIEFNKEVKETVWDDQKQQWGVKLADGEVHFIY